ncbi:MAG: hypothetical protein U0K34_06155 [Ruminococcus sp.]|jgi:hypothetical protein|nr:hypothetical protein [Ruminococcus sp.]
MITNLAFAYDYVSDIPWDKNPAFAFSDDTDKYLSAFKHVVEFIPTPDLKIRYTDMVWDFNPYFKHMNDDSVRIIFNGLPGDLVDYCKFFVLHKIMMNKKISTVNVRFSDFKSIINQINEESNGKSFVLITTDDLIDAVKSRNVSSSTAHNLYEALYQVYYFIINNYKIELPVDLGIIKELGVKAMKLTKTTVDEDKIPNIPEEFFKKIVSMATSVMRDEKEEYNIRAFCCELIMLTQLGLRLGDLTALTLDRLHSMELKKIHKTANYIHYSSLKPSKPHSPMLEFDIYCSPLCAEAYNTLKKIRNQCQFYKDNDFLFILDPVKNSRNDFPVSKNRFNLMYRQFLFNYLPEDAQRPWGVIKPVKYITWSKEKKQIIPYMLYVPDTRQYRVHLCTELYNHGVSLVFIQKYMGHLTAYMLGYYVRPKTDFQEDLDFSGKFIKEVAGDGITPLGGDNNGEELQTQIKAFINAGNYNVYDDIDEIMKAFGDKIVIRAKTGGVCVKTSLIPCSKDKRSDRIMCAYGLCPNLFHMFYMADVSYFNFKQMQKTYNANLKSGHKISAERELEKMKDVLHRRLIPELDQLDETMSKKGMDYVLEHYPMLYDIITNEANIRKEIATWMKKK